MIKKVSCIVAVIAVLFMLSFSHSISAQEQKYIDYFSDLFMVKFAVPNDWNTEVTSEFLRFTSPRKDVELIYSELLLFDDKTLEQEFEEYKTYVEEKKWQILEKKSIKLAGLDAYYIRVSTEHKDVGHIMFKRNPNIYFIALKTPLGEYEKYYPVLQKVLDSFSLLDRIEQKE